jgi:hypothetical protein
MRQTLGLRRATKLNPWLNRGSKESVRSLGSNWIPN